MVGGKGCLAGENGKDTKNFTKQHWNWGSIHSKYCTCENIIQIYTNTCI